MPSGPKRRGRYSPRITPLGTRAARTTLRRRATPPQPPRGRKTTHHDSRAPRATPPAPRPPGVVVAARWRDSGATGASGQTHPRPAGQVPRGAPRAPRAAASTGGATGRKVREWRSREAGGGVRARDAPDRRCFCRGCIVLALPERANCRRSNQTGRPVAPSIWAGRNRTRVNILL